MKRVVRFAEDGEHYVAGDFGDDGEATQAKINSGEYVVLTMIVYDEDKITDLTTDDDLFTSDAFLDSLSCIVVESSGFNTGMDYTSGNVDAIDNEYLRSLAHEALRCAGCAIAPGHVHDFEAPTTVRDCIMQLLDFPLDAPVFGFTSGLPPSFAISGDDGNVYISTSDNY